MNKKNWLLKLLTQLYLLALLCVSMNAGAIGNTMSWREEVLLHDGQVIVAERSYNPGDSATPDSPDSSALEETVTFNLPDSRKIVWTTNFRDAEPEPNSLNLILFDVVKGVPYIAAYPADCNAHKKWKRPNPPQVFFKYEKNRWKRIALKKFPVELKEANVIVGRPDMRNLQAFYTVKQVNLQNDNIHAPEYRTTMRKALARGKCAQRPGSPKAPVKKAPGTAVK